MFIFFLFVGLDEEGLYRLPGSLLRTNDLLARGMANKPLRFAEEETKTLCSALKSYFRKMENPLMTFELQDELLEIASKFLYSTSHSYHHFCVFSFL